MVAYQNPFLRAAAPRMGGLNLPEDPSLMGQIGGAAMSGLSTVGNILDLPGSVIRDLASTALGRPENPLDQFLSPFSSENRITGRDVLERGGLLGSNTPGLDWGDVGGFVGEVALDPLTYLTFGGSALTKAGKAAKAAGTLQKTRAGRIAAGQGGLFGIGLPFTAGKSIGGTGARSLAAAEKMDALGDAIKYGKYSPVRVARGLFDPSVKNQFGEQGQRIAEAVTGGEAGAHYGAAKAADDAEDVFSAAYGKVGQNFAAPEGVNPQSHFADMVQHAAERRPQEAVQLFAPEKVADADFLNTVGEAAQQLRAGQDAFHQGIKARGGATTTLMPEAEGYGVEHLARYASRESAQEAAAQSRRIAGLSGKATAQRTAPIRDVPKEVIRRMQADPGVMKGDISEAVYHLEKNYNQWLNPAYADELGQTVHAEALADYLRGKKAPIFDSGGLLRDDRIYKHSAANIQNSLDGIHEYVGDVVKRMDKAGLTGDVPLAKAFNVPGMNKDEAVNWFAKEVMGGMDPAEAAKLKIPQEVADGIKSVMNMMSSPEEYAGIIGSLFDAVNNSMRGISTLIWPGFHVRNRMSGIFNNLASGHVDSPADALKYAKYERAHRQILKEGSEELREYNRAMSAADKGFRRGLQTGETVGFEGVSTADADPLTRAMMGIPGLRTAGKVQQKALDVGAKVMQRLERDNRASMWLYLTREKGFTPLEAAKEVTRLHFDYADLTRFERNVAKRGFLFYTFSRKMFPLMMRNLLERPGGLMAQTIRGSNRMGGSQGPTPDYIAQTLSIPLGETETGDQRFLAGFGLPHEDPLSFLGGGVQDSLLELASRTSPLLKAPAEWAAGETFFQRGPSGGRSLEDLDPTIGRTLSNLSDMATGEQTRRADPFIGRPFEFLAANSPLSRPLTTARQLTDPRKGLGAKALNLLTGARISDVSPAAQDAVLREQYEDLLRQYPGTRIYENIYLPKEELEKMSQDEARTAVSVQHAIRMLQKRAKERATAG